MSPRPPHLLYVVWGYPPCRGGGVYRALATANAFAGAGWRVTVLTADEATFERFTGADPTLLDRVDPSIRIERVPFAWPAQETDVRTYSPLRVYAPRVWRRVRKRLDLLPFPEIGYGPWRRPLERRAVRIHDADPVDLTLSTANPNVTFAAAWKLHQSRGVPYVMDYRDAWMLDVFGGGRLHDPAGRAAKWEARLVREAREVWFVNEPIRSWHADLYPARADDLHVVANGWDAELAPRTAVTDPAALSGRPPVFGYLGTLSPKVPLEPLIQGWRAARAGGGLMEQARLALHGYLGYYATPRPEMLALVEAARGDGVTYEGPVAKTEIAAVYGGFDVLVLALGAGRYVTSGKVFEYLATAKPIVSVHDPANAASDVLRDYPLWFPVADLSAAEIARALTEAADAARTVDPQTRARCHQVAARYRRDLQLLPRVEALATGLGRSTEASPV